MSNTLSSPSSPSSPSSRLATLIATSALSLAATHAGAATVAYVSNADSQDIYVLRLNGDGSVNLIDKVDTGSTVMPLALSPDHKFLYAALRGQPYSVVSYAIDPASGKLKALSKAPLADNMANIATDRSGRYLLAASYSGNRISVNAIGTDGTVQAPPLAVIPTGKNAHSVQVSPDNVFAFASNLGSDVILQYRFDPATGTVTPNSPPSVATKAGAGPRHFVFSPDQRFVYSTNELDATVNTYAYNRQSGTLTLQGSDSALPDGFKTSEQLAAAALHLTSDGRFLYAPSAPPTPSPVIAWIRPAASWPASSTFPPKPSRAVSTSIRKGVTCWLSDRRPASLATPSTATAGRSPRSSATPWGAIRIGSRSSTCPACAEPEGICFTRRSLDVLFFELAGCHSGKLFHICGSPYEVGLIQNSQPRVLPVHNAKADIC